MTIRYEVDCVVCGGQASVSIPAEIHPEPWDFTDAMCPPCRKFSDDVDAMVMEQLMFEIDPGGESDESPF